MGSWVSLILGFSSLQEKKNNHKKLKKSHIWLIKAAFFLTPVSDGAHTAAVSSHQRQSDSWDEALLSPTQIFYQPEEEEPQ